MNWKFWKTAGAVNTEIKLPKPKEMPTTIGRHLVVNLKKDPDWVWSLNYVELAQEGNGKQRNFRVYDNTLAMAGGVSVKHYRSLDDHPELVLFTGVFDQGNDKMELREASARA